MQVTTEKQQVFVKPAGLKHIRDFGPGKAMHANLELDPDGFVVTTVRFADGKIAAVEALSRPLDEKLETRIIYSGVAA